MPIERAGPAMIASAASMSRAFRSGIFVSAIWRSWAFVNDATFTLCGVGDPLSTLAAFLMSSAAGGVLVMKVNERSSYTEIATGMTLPRCDSVCALYCLQNSMMLTPCWPRAGPIGGAGVAAPALICSLMIAASFFFGGMTGPSWVESETKNTGRRVVLDLGDLTERELDRRLAAEDGHQHLELLLVGVDLADARGQRGERAVGDGNRLAHLEVDDAWSSGSLGFLLLLGRGREKPEHLVEGQRRRLARAWADKAGDGRGVADRRPRLVGHLHADQEVAGEDVALDDLPLAVLDLGDLFLGHLDLVDEVLHVQGLDPGLEVCLRLVLIARVGVHDEPVARSAAQCVAEGLRRIDLDLGDTCGLDRRIVGVKTDLDANDAEGVGGRR